MSARSGLFPPGRCLISPWTALQQRQAKPTSGPPCSKKANQVVEFHMNQNHPKILVTWGILVVGAYQRLSRLVPGLFSAWRLAPVGDRFVSKCPCRLQPEARSSLSSEESGVALLSPTRRTQCQSSTSTESQQISNRGLRFEFHHSFEAHRRSSICTLCAHCTEGPLARPDLQPCCRGDAACIRSFLCVLTPFASNTVASFVCT